MRRRMLTHELEDEVKVRYGQHTYVLPKDRLSDRKGPNDVEVVTTETPLPYSFFTDRRELLLD